MRELRKKSRMDWLYWVITLFAALAVVVYLLLKR